MDMLNVEKKDKVTIITLNRPPANALAKEVISRLSEIFDQLESDRNVKAIVIHGEGRFFSAGADIKEFTAVEFSVLAEKGQNLFDKMEAFPKPIIAAIHGAALGGGLELAMACHIRIAAKGTKLGLPELQLGLIPGFAGTQRLPRLVGVPKATEMILSSEPIDAEEAYQTALVSRLVEPDALMNEAVALATRFAEKSSVSVAYALECLSYARQGLKEQGQALERELFAKVFQSHDAQEGIKAFVEKRKPNFQDR